MNLFYTKKAMEPIIAVSLLIVVTVVAVIGYQSWYNNYQSQVFSEVNVKTSQNAKVNIEFISNDGLLYITNTGTNNVFMSTIKIGDTDCLINQNLTPGVNNFSISSCINSNLTISKVVIVTDNNIIQKEIFTKDVITAIPLVIVLSTSLSCDTDLDGDGYISFTCAQYPMTDTTLEGHLDTNDNNLTITADYTCAWNNNKTNCLNNFVVNGCGTGTVLDIGTGLCWQRDFTNTGTKTWVNAKSYCDTTIDGLGGHSDWYLPSRQEFETIVDLSRSSAPHIAGGNNNKFQNVVSNYYWTKTTYGSSTTNAFLVALSLGYSVSTDKTGGFYVACVRRN